MIIFYGNFQYIFRKKKNKIKNKFLNKFLYFVFLKEEYLNKFNFLIKI